MSDGFMMLTQNNTGLLQHSKCALCRCNREGRGPFMTLESVCPERRRTLRSCMRQQSGAARVVWYDAVTAKGDLTWQNTLNDLNRPFFGAADAILVNYAWKVGPPLQGALTPPRVLGFSVYAQPCARHKTDFHEGSSSCITP